jgi:hypothetical protein
VIVDKPQILCKLHGGVQANLAQIRGQIWVFLDDRDGKDRDRSGERQGFCIQD